MVRLFFGLLIGLICAAPVSAASNDELLQLLAGLKNANKLSGMYYEGRRHIHASFKVDNVEYGVEYERAWSVRTLPPNSLRPVRRATLVIQREESGPRTYKSETFINYGFDGVADYASALHQPPFGRGPPKDYVYASRRANCVLMVIRCRTTGSAWKDTAQERFGTVVREMITALNTVE